MTKKYEKLKTNPKFLFAILLLVILVAEVLVMVVLPNIIPADAPLFVRNITDGVLLTILVAPILWKLIVSPLRGDLYQAQRRAQIILNSAHKGVLTVDKDGFIKSINPAAQKLLNKPKEELIDKNYRDLILPLNHLTLEDKRDEEFAYMHNGNNKKYLRLTSVKVILDDELFYTFFLEDITEKKQLELALEFERAKATTPPRQM